MLRKFLPATELDLRYFEEWPTEPFYIVSSDGPWSRKWLNGYAERGESLTIYPPDNTEDEWEPTWCLVEGVRQNEYGELAP